MEIKPYSHTVLSAEEAAALVLCAPEALPSVSCSLPDGSVVEIDVDADNTVNLLSLGIPSKCHVHGTPQGTNAAAFDADVEIIERHYFELDELKGYGDGTDDFSDRTDDELRAKREKATEVFERAAGRSFVRRMGTTAVYAPQGFVPLEHCDVERIIAPDYRLVSDCQAEAIGKPVEGCEIVYIYGKRMVPEAVKEAVLALAAYYLRASATPDRATGEATEAGFLRYTIAGRDGATGIPEIDAIAEQFGRKRYGVA